MLRYNSHNHFINKLSSSFTNKQIERISEPVVSTSSQVINKCEKNSMYQRKKPISVKSSASLVSNNLSVYVSPDQAHINYAIVHKSCANMVSATTDGSAITHRQTVCKDPGSTSYNGNRNIVMQACWVPLSARLVFVLASQNGIQMYEGDGCTMLYWQSLGNGDKPNSESGEGSSIAFARGIAGMSKNLICVGTSMNHIFVYVIPAKGTKVQHKSTLTGHESSICDLASDDQRLVSGDDMGNIIVWRLDESLCKLEQEILIKGSGSPCASIGLWGDIVVGGYGNGYIRVFDARKGTLGAEVTAHARWIHAIQIAKSNGMVLSVSEDSFARVWQLSQDPSPSIQLRHNECVADSQLVGGAFVEDEGRAFCVIGYDSTELVFCKHT